MALYSLAQARILHDFIKGIQQVHSGAKVTGHRRLLFVTGERKRAAAGIQHWLKRQCITAGKGVSFAWVSDDVPSDLTMACYGEGQGLQLSQTAQLLGQTIECLVFDAWAGLNPNRLLAASGAVSGGGVIIIMCPELEVWPQYLDADYQSLNALAPSVSERLGEAPQVPQSAFLARLVGFVKESASNEHESSVAIWDDKKACWLGVPSQATKQSSSVLSFPFLSDEAVAAQTKLLQDILQRFNIIEPSIDELPQFHGVITAPRGRGKTYLLVQLIQALVAHSHYPICLVVADKVSLSPQLKALAQRYPERIQLLSPYEATCLAEPHTAVLIVDEAAALPISVLKALAQRFESQILATTTEGYEGSGSGFIHKYFQFLNANKPHWKQLSLSTPVRWRPNDPVEALFQQCFQAHPSQTQSDKAAQALVACDPQALQYRRLSVAELLENEALLQQVFGLLAQAHYKTTANDLRMLLDATNLVLWLAETSLNQVVGVCLAALEGPLDNDLAHAIWQGKRRPKGQLVPQVLVGQEGLKEAAQLQFLRVVRVAVHPAIRRRGVGQALISQLNDWAQALRIDGLATSFGASRSLVEFWHALGFQWVRLGYQQDKVSGEYALVMVKPFSASLEALLARQAEMLSRRWMSDYRRYWRSLDVHLLPYLFKALPKEPLSSQEQAELEGFAEQSRSFESSYPALCRWLVLTFSDRAGQPLDVSWQAMAEVLWLEYSPRHMPNAASDKAGVKQMKALLKRELKPS
ncbi:MAG: GNAT family N-acetyltransferase [Pontibacterium sp.]